MPLSTIRKYRRRFHSYDKITGMTKIARRYFVLNAFDGALTMFGLVLGSFLAGVRNPFLIFSIGISTAMALGISGLWGASLSEAAERKGELRLLEKSMMRKLSSSYIGEALRAATYLAAVVNSLSPMLAAFIILLPFLLAGNSLLKIELAYSISLGLSFVIFFALGMFLGRISKETWWMAGLKMFLAGLTAAVLLYLLSTTGLVVSA